MTQCSLQILSYGTFYDFPRGIYVRVAEHTVALECEFDDTADDYKDYYKVFLIVGAIARDVQMGTFRSEKYRHVYLGELPVKEVIFDASRRKSLKSLRLESIMAQHILPILSYGTSSDFPRGMYVKVAEYVVSLECEFDDTTEDYKDHYKVFIAVDAAPHDILIGTFRSENQNDVYIGDLPLKDINFDVSKTKSLRSAKLEEMVIAYQQNETV